MLRKTMNLFALAIILLLLVGCGGQNQDYNEEQHEEYNPDPHGLSGVWEHIGHRPRRLEISGTDFILTTYNHNRVMSVHELTENDPGFDEFETGEIDSDTYFALTGRNVDPDVYKIEISSVLQWQTIIESIPRQRISIWYRKVDDSGALALTAQNFEEYLRIYDDEPGFALIVNNDPGRGGSLDFDTYYQLTGTKADENYVYRIAVDSFTHVYFTQDVWGDTQQIMFTYSTTLRRDGRFILMDDGRMEVIWNDTGSVQVYYFDRTPNTITFAGLRYQRVE